MLSRGIRNKVIPRSGRADRWARDSTCRALRRNKIRCGDERRYVSWHFEVAQRVKVATLSAKLATIRNNGRNNAARYNNV